MLIAGIGELDKEKFGLSVGINLCIMLPTIHPSFILLYKYDCEKLFMQNRLFRWPYYLEKEL